VKAVMLAMLMSVTDGDTIKVNINHLPQLFGHNLPVRLAHINTPELRGCDPARAAAAKKFVTDTIPVGNYVNLTNCKRGSFFRVVCDVTYRGKNISQELLKHGLADPYGAKKRCP
jgi:endonuclease YncB( thermonuclease family)